MQHTLRLCGSAVVAALLIVPGVSSVDLVSGGACDLVTRQEAAAALDAPVPAGIDKAMDVPLQGHVIKQQLCMYGSEILVSRMTLGSGAAAYFAAYRKSLKSRDDYQDVAGLGDEAFIAKGQLNLRKGSDVLTVDVGQARGGAAKEVKAEKALAAVALARM